MPKLNPKFSVKKAHEMQLRLSKKLLFEDTLPEAVNYVAGVDVAYLEGTSVAAVAVLDLKGQKVFQVTGGKITEKTFAVEEEKLMIPEEDMRLVADQTGKSLEEARQALAESGGDLAKAILLLQTR